MNLNITATGEEAQKRANGKNIMVYDVKGTTGEGQLIGEQAANPQPGYVFDKIDLLLRLLRSPAASHQPGRPTWPFEMHQVYRVNASSTVDITSIDLRISLGDLAGGRTFVDAAGRQVPFLQLFGLDEDAAALLRNADLAMYRAKSGGKGGETRHHGLQASKGRTPAVPVAWRQARATIAKRALTLRPRHLATAARRRSKRSPRWRTVCGR